MRRLVALALMSAVALAGCSGAPGGPQAARFPQQAPPTPGATSPAPSDGASACNRDTLIGTIAARSVEAKASPSLGAPTIASFARINAQGAPQVFDLVKEMVGTHGEVWYRALLPMRPNGTMGFIQARVLRLSQTPYRIVVSRAHLTLTLWSGCQVVRRYRIGLGTLDTPTPVGTFYLTSLLKPPVPNSVYGAYAYGLSAYSNAITTWKWGGMIGLHGTNDLSSIGKRMSHGCIRMRNGDIRSLVRMLPLGTPIEID